MRDDPQSPVRADERGGRAGVPEGNDQRPNHAIIQADLLDAVGGFGLFDQTQAKLRYSEIAARTRRTLQLSGEFFRDALEPIRVMRISRAPSRSETSLRLLRSVPASAIVLNR